MSYSHTISAELISQTANIVADLDKADAEELASHFRALICQLSKASAFIDALIKQNEELGNAYQYAVSENIAFNFKVASEINEARSQRDAALAELRRLTSLNSGCP